MSASLGNTGRKKRYRRMSEINVTPMVDVMLVLLIVFMVTAPMLTIGVPVDLPKAGAQSLPEDDKPIEVSMDASGQIYLSDVKVGAEELVARLGAITNNRKDARIYVRGDQNLTYGQIMAVIGAINSAGYRKVALVTKRKE